MFRYHSVYVYQAATAIRFFSLSLFSLCRSTWILIKFTIYIIIFDQVNGVRWIQSTNKHCMHNNNLIWVAINQFTWKICTIIRVSFNLESGALRLINEFFEIYEPVKYFIHYDIFTSLKIQRAFLRTVASNSLPMHIHIHW